jgi:hypothetical protein
LELKQRRQALVASSVHLAAGVFFLAMAVVLFWDYIYPLGRPARMLFGDFPRHFYPYRAFATSMLANWQLPLWNPFEGCGIDFVARLETAAFYPTHLLLPLISGEKLSYSFYQAYNLLHFGLYGFTTYLALRYFGAGLLGSLFGGLAALGCGYCVLWAHAPTRVWIAACLPLVLCGLYLALKNTSWRAAAFAGLALGAAILGGRLQLMLYFGVCLCILWLAWSLPVWLKDLSKLRACLVLGCVIALGGLLVGAVQILPSAELAQGSARVGRSGLFLAGLGSMKLKHMLHWLANSSITLGSLPLALALAGLAGRFGRLTLGLGLMTLWAGMYAMGKNSPLLPLMVNNLPGFGLFRWCDTSLVLAHMGVFGLAGLGLDWLAGSQKDKQTKSCLCAATLLILFLALLKWAGISWLNLWPYLAIATWCLGKALWAGLPHAKLALACLACSIVATTIYSGAKLPLWDSYQPDEVYQSNPRVEWLKKAQAGREDFRIFQQGYLTSVPAWEKDPHIWPSKALTGLMHRIPAAGFATELFDSNMERTYKLTSTNQRLFDQLNVAYLPVPKGVKKPKGFKYTPFIVQKGLGRVLLLEGIVPGKARRIRLISQVANGMGMPQSQAIAYLRVWGQASDPIGFPIRAGMETAEWALDRPGANPGHEKPKVAGSWPVKGEGYQGHNYMAEFSLPTEMEIQRLELAHSGGGEALHIKDILFDATSVFKSGPRWQRAAPEIWQNRWVLPRAYLVGHALVMKNKEDQDLAMANLEPAWQVMLSDDPPKPMPGKAAPAIKENRVRVIERENQKVVLEAKLSKPGYLILAESYAPGWRATSNGRDIKVLRANLMFKALSLGPGKHLVEFSYRSNGFTVGAAASLAGLCVLLLLALWPVIRSRRVRR